MLSTFRAQQRAAFIPFVIAGHPTIDASEAAIDVLIEEGADLIEIGVPFSDAMADGPVIQTASEAAAKHMESVGDTLALTSRVNAKHPTIPLILFTYFNPLLRFGLESFALLARASGVTAVLVVDLPPEEASEYAAILARNQLKTIFLASPTSSKERMRQIAAASTGFVYYVSRTGVTGVQAQVSQTLAHEIDQLKMISAQGIAVGFGISDGAQAAVVARLADAVVVGSAFVKLQDLAGLRALAREISSAVRTARDVESSGIRC